ncbi:hypothetical protein [Aureimonas sp. AU12]|uniref:hypothetical protein n=1 Tax=Aureimonas sp. AU12 TaxID=1638161 RepID=UPI0007830979|nr:hypothetical protein [Aureimonas sp. AU12]
MIEIPAISDIASAAVLVGALFVVRYLVAMRRIWMTVGRPRGFVIADYWRATQVLAFGPEFEPDRRHAARQLYVGLAFLALGLVLFAWLLTLEVLGPFFVKGNLA